MRRYQRRRSRPVKPFVQDLKLCRTDRDRVLKAGVYLHRNDEHGTCELGLWAL